MSKKETPFHTLDDGPYRGGDSFDNASLEEVMRFVWEAIDFEAAGVKIGEILVGFGRLRPAEVTTKLQGHWAGRVLDAAFGITDDV
ncbi:hypothetical protein LCGC14_2611400 [marine sediment metagenome]|uniref:Uncharacterized protein n=1 Tax=marine sediment metagenome TaxID=412755 RepID=A0A0F9A5S0_9ZZZZ